MFEIEDLGDGSFMANFYPSMEEEKKGPEVPPEIHNKRPIDPEKCMQEMRVLCGDRR